MTLTSIMMTQEFSLLVQVSLEQSIKMNFYNVHLNIHSTMYNFRNAAKNRTNTSYRQQFIFSLYILEINFIIRTRSFFQTASFMLSGMLYKNLAQTHLVHGY